ncbi:phosphoenolpyruvate synthase [Candidatus Peregrinibacteria bacterium]|nr:phosphoenolpyruvate synthase [Candidatus Peregrinibacteria bacterium]
MTKNKKFILWFEEIDIKDVPDVGGKNASLGEMYQNLCLKNKDKKDEQILVPNGFAVTAYAYHYLLKKAGIEEKIRKILKGLNTSDVADLMQRGLKVRETIYKAKFPEELEKEIIVAYKKLEKEYEGQLDVAVRSSATAEDLPDASFAGQQETYLNIRGEKALIEACKNCFASLFTNRAISYREDKHFDHFSICLSKKKKKMVRSDLACSGVMFSIDTETGFENMVLINGSYGLGENIVQGKVNPDEFYVFKKTLDEKHKPIIRKKLGSKEIKMVYSKNKKNPTKNVPVKLSDQERFVIEDKIILKLAKWACLIETHYKKPMDMEWAMDGRDGKLYIVQARPETVESQKDRSYLEEYHIENKGKLLTTGSPVGTKIGVGKANIIHDVQGIHDFKKNDVLVTDMTDPDWEPIMKIAAAIVTNRGGRTCHAAIISRELGIPCIVGTNNATEVIKNQQMITVSCSEGERGYIYNGSAKIRIKRIDLKKIKRPKTKIMMNLGDPDIAIKSSFIPNDGVGLAREEFIINNYIKIHPLALIHYRKIKDKKVKTRIEEITKGYKNKTDFFVDKLAEGIGLIGSAFYPRDVIVRLSDFKSNEYANLIGGKDFEPLEDNPMIGWRGASRYYSKVYRPAFDLECQAHKKVRQQMGLKNIKIMIPFCRTVDEAKKVVKIMEENGLCRGKDDLELYMMCEIPSNVTLVNEFSEIFDGFSIGSNDLTQLVLGIDRDSALVSHIYDERNEAVKRVIASVIKKAKSKKKKIGICGQAPSDFIDFAEFLVEQGIDSISLNPDTIIKTTLDIVKTEERLASLSKKK